MSIPNGEQVKQVVKDWAEAISKRERRAILARDSPSFFLQGLAREVTNLSFVLAGLQAVHSVYPAHAVHSVHHLRG